jgi:hypothetical protein
MVVVAKIHHRLSATREMNFWSASNQLHFYLAQNEKHSRLIIVFPPCAVKTANFDYGAGVAIKDSAANIHQWKGALSI